MGNITSSHDQLRFSGYADGQIQFSDNGTARSFDDPVGKIRQLSTYSKMANFHAFNITQPGIPIIYYGEEIALMGEGDPGNRRMMRFNISDNEMELKKTFSLLNGLRTEYSSLALGDQMILYNEGPVLILLKKYFNEMILVAFNNSQDSKTIEIEFPLENTLLTKLIGLGHYEMNDKLIKLTINPLSHDFYFSEK
jgi:glycosidase